MKSNTIRATIVICLLSLSLIVNLYSESVNDTVRSSVNTNESDQTVMVGLNVEERWPVLRVEFPSKPFPNSLLQSFFEGDYSANQYISEMSGGRSTLEETLIPGVWQSPYSESQWGADSTTERDIGVEGNGAKELAEQVILSLMSNQDLSSWDLNGDFVIDRVLILHSGQPQEVGGPSSGIWSHFSPFDEYIEIGEYRFEHYTMASVHGGVGVVVHEMLHQMGALDLYDVHSDSPTKSWHGLGDWDIMASGNWIENGDRPSLPSASTLNIIGATEPQNIEIFEDANYTIIPTWNGGSPLKVNIAPDEFIWLSLRTDHGFDRGLPGHGILIEQQDLFFGDIDSNLVNTDPTKPWAKVIEADGNDALLRARDHGDEGDVFIEGDIIGIGGYEIWDNRGRLVPWRITVTALGHESAEIHYEYLGDRNTSVITPRSPIVLLPNETAYAEISTDSECNFIVDTNIDQEAQFNQPKEGEVELIVARGIGTKGTITGEIGCEGRPLTSISIQWNVINHRLSNDTLEATVPWDESSTIRLYPKSQGEGHRSYRISLDGPVSRIATVVTSGTYLPGDPIVINVEPDGLLEPRMIARGEMVIIDSDNIEQRIPVVLSAEGDLPFGPLNWLTVPSNAITMVLILLAFTVGSGKGERSIS